MRMQVLPLSVVSVLETLIYCFQNMVASGQPLEGLKNIYSDNHAIALLCLCAVPHLGDLLASCRDLPSPIYISAPEQSREGPRKLDGRDYCPAGYFIG